MLKDIIMLWDINDWKRFLHIHNICFEEPQGFFCCLLVSFLNYSIYLKKNFPYNEI